MTGFVVQGHIYVKVKVYFEFQPSWTVMFTPCSNVYLRGSGPWSLKKKMSLNPTGKLWNTVVQFLFKMSPITFPFSRDNSVLFELSTSGPSLVVFFQIASTDLFREFLKELGISNWHGIWTQKPLIASIFLGILISHFPLAVAAPAYIKTHRAHSTLV